LHGIDQHAGDVAPFVENAQRIFRHIVEGVSLARRNGIADAGLNVAPPAMVGTTEPDKMTAPRVIARQPDRLHHRFSSRHVERDFVKRRNLAKALNIVGYHRMIKAEHRPEFADELRAPLDALLIEIIPEKVDSIRCRQVVERVTVEISNGDAGRGLYERWRRQVRAHKAAELKRHPVSVGKSQGGNALLYRI